jgi:hypothetical protein
MEIGSPEEVSGCFLTKLEAVTSRAGFRKPQTTHRGQTKRYNYSRSNAIEKSAVCRKNLRNRLFEKPGAVKELRSAATKALPIQYATTRFASAAAGTGYDFLGGRRP